MKGEVPEDTYKIIAISDIHMRNDWPYSTDALDRHRTDRFLSQMGLWRHVDRTAAREKADAVIVIGDLFDRPLVDPVTMAGTVEALLGVRSAPLYIIPGNHDEHRKGSFQTEVFGELGAKNITLLNHDVPFCPREWLRFWPYHYRKGGIEDELALHASLHALAGKVGAASYASTQEVALIHQSVKGCSHLGWVCDDGLDPSKLDSFNYTLAGHFHDHQFFIPNRGMYLGAPQHHHFGDVGRPAQYWVVEFRKGKKWSVKPVDPGLPKFHTMEWDEEYTGGPERGDFLRINFHASASEFDGMKDAIEEAKAGFEDDGINAHVKFHPIYHHGARLKPEKGSTEVFTIDDMIEPYVEHPSVSTDGLDENRLVAMGRKFLSEARRA